ncbi:MAG: T9SS type A sorting domain-containing protein [Ignavibacteriales bacterium]|nr:T9SS type A sorting domain-containing protein [Ignavibacteriales bacterium]
MIRWHSVVACVLCFSFLRAQVGTLEASLKISSVNTVAVPTQHGMVVSSYEKQLRPTVSLAGQWKKIRFSANHTVSLTKRDSAGYAQLMTEAAGKTSPYFDDNAWGTHAIPGVENQLGSSEQTPEYYSDGVWYRRTFIVPDSLQQKFVRLNFYAVNYIGDVWLNGHYLGWHEGGFTPFSFDVSNALRFDSANVLAVRVDNIPWGTRKDIVPYYPCDWFNYTGIIHDVYLEFSDKISTARADVVPRNTTGLVQASVVINNKNLSSENVDILLRVFRTKTDSVSLAKEITAELIGEEAAIEGVSQQSISVPPDSFAAWQTDLTIQNPQLWSPKTPNLYILKVTVSQGGSIKDEFFTQFGLRTIKTAGDKIILNEKPLFLHGVARHEDHPQYGRSIPPNVIFSDLKIVKSVYANYLRTGHYPNHPFTYLAADRLGLIIMEEIPVWWFDESFSWLIQNSVRKIHHQMFREMVFRDYNRPSIALWSTSNECKDVSGRISFLQSVKAELDAQYPDGRLITQSAAADRPGPNDDSQTYCDVAGWTMYFGIFYNPNGLGMYRGTKYFLVDAHDYFPKKPVIATEFGYWSTEGMTQFTEQVQTFDSTFLAFQPRLPIEKNGTYNAAGFVAGVTWWCIFDWYTHQQTSGFQSMGLIRMNRTEAKPVKTTLSSMYKQYSNYSEYITAVETKPAQTIPKAFSLEQNHPNPFNPATTITFSLPVSANVEIKIYDILGKEIATLVDERMGPGTFSKIWNTSAVPSGVYLYQIHARQSEESRAEQFSKTRKMVLIK